MPIRVTPTLRDDLAAAKRPLIGMWLSTGSPLVAEICAGSGLDWVLIDAEHGPNDLTSILPQLQALAGLPGDDAGATADRRHRADQAVPRDRRAEPAHPARATRPSRRPSSSAPCATRRRASAESAAPSVAPRAGAACRDYVPNAGDSISLYLQIESATAVEQRRGDPRGRRRRRHLRRTGRPGRLDGPPRRAGASGCRGRRRETASPSRARPASPPASTPPTRTLADRYLAAGVLVRLRRRRRVAARPRHRGPRGPLHHGGRLMTDAIDRARQDHRGPPQLPIARRAARSHAREPVVLPQAGVVGRRERRRARAAGRHRAARVRGRDRADHRHPRPPRHARGGLGRRLGRDGGERLRALRPACRRPRVERALEGRRRLHAARPRRDPGRRARSCRASRAHLGQRRARAGGHDRHPAVPVRPARRRPLAAAHAGTRRRHPDRHPRGLVGRRSRATPSRSRSTCPATGSRAQAGSSPASPRARCRSPTSARSPRWTTPSASRPGATRRRRARASAEQARRAP